MVLLHLCLLFTLTAAIEIGNDLNVDLELIKHQPCGYSAGKSKWTRKIEFESGNAHRGPKLEEVEGRPGCYAVGGKVNVLQDFTGNFSVYIEVRNTANLKSVPESCTKAGADGCGGVGSCLYCDACNTFGSAAGVQAQLLLNGKSVQCKDGLLAGQYDDLKLVFCLPNIDDILEGQGLSKETLLELIRSNDGSTFRSLSLFATVYIFDTDVKRQMQAQQRVESIWRTEHNKKSFFKDERLPEDVYWQLPFNSMIKKAQPYIGCHKIYGNVKIHE